MVSSMKFNVGDKVQIKYSPAKDHHHIDERVYKALEGQALTVEKALCAVPGIHYPRYRVEEYLFLIPEHMLKRAARRRP